jgi:hypothetical protein
MNRLKLLLLLLIIAALAIVFVQNQEPITLKLLCPDTTQACLYQTRQFPLAVWIGLFTLGGLLTNLLGQVFSRYGYASSSKPKYTTASKPRYTNNDLYPEQQNWVDEDREQKFQKVERNQRNYSTDSTQIQDSPILDGFNKSNSYEKPQEPQNVERSGSTYSYKYRTVTERSPKVGFASSPNLDAEPSPNIKDSTAKTSNESVRESNINSQEDDEDWI